MVQIVTKPQGDATYASFIDSRHRGMGAFVQSAIDPDLAVVRRPTSALTIPTGFAGNDVVEPAVRFFPDGKFGWEYWMLACPYYQSDDANENPSLWVSHDGNTWQVAPGVTNPIYPTNGAGGGHNSDGDLFEGVDGNLYIIWNQFGAGANDWRVNLGSSPDGRTWSAQQVVISTDKTVTRPTSPCVLFDPSLGLYVMYAIDTVPSPNTLLRYTATTPAGPWTLTTAPTFTFPLAGRELWHMNAYLVGNQHVLLVDDTPLNGSGPGYLHLAVSNDRGATFTFGKRPMLDFAGPAGAWDSGSYYRSALIPAHRGDQAAWDLYIGGVQTGNTGWSIARTRITFDRQRHGNAITAKVSTGEGRYYCAPASGAPTTQAWTNGDFRMAKALFDRTVTLSEVGVDVTAIGDAAATYRFAIYADTGTGKPGQLVADLGSTAPITATGYTPAACNVTLPPGMYWIGGCAQNVTTTAPTVRTSTLTGDPCVGALTVALLTANANGGWRMGTGVTGAPPLVATLTSASELTANAPRVVWKVA